MNINIGDWIKLVDAENFNRQHGNNYKYTNEVGAKHAQVTRFDSDGDIKEVTLASGRSIEFTITRGELRNFRKMNSGSEYGQFKIIITYANNNETIEEEGIVSINVTDKSVGYVFNRKKLGFIKYQGEVELQIDELKQITITTHESTRVMHIENGIIIREHVMYDNERIFKGFKIEC